MAVGFFHKLVDVAKKIGNGAKKVWSVAKPIVQSVLPAVRAIPHPAGQIIGKAWDIGAPIADKLLGDR